jgi:GT2 family glycosyltransferase
VLVDSGEGAAAVASAELGGIPHRTIAFDQERFNFSRACNLGAGGANGEYLVFLNDDIRVESGDWLEFLLGQCQLPRAGIVGAKLVFEGGLIQNAGIVLDRLWPPPSRHFVAAAYAYRPDLSSGYRERLAVARDVSAVTGACAMIPAQVLAEVGGWDEALRMDYGDIDLSLRVRAAGRSVVIEPRAVLTHEESATQGYGDEDRGSDRRVFLDRWRADYAAGDPCYHPLCRFDRDWEP